MKRLILALAVGLVPLTQAHAQLPPGLPIPPENFAATHFLGSPNVTNIEHVGMGNAFVADKRRGWHGNPAGLTAIKEPTFLALHTQANYSLIPDFRSNFFGLAYPIDKKNVVKLAGVTVRAAGSTSNTPVPIGVRASEDDISFEFARKVNDKLSVGFGSAYLSTESSYRIPGLGTPSDVVTRLSSRPTSLGGRIGAIWSPNEKLSLGVTHDNYTEKVTRSVPAFGLPTSSFKFHSTGYRVGIAIYPDAKTTMLMDYENLQLVGNNTKVSRRPLMGGIERKIGNMVALRVGSFDGKLTGGVGMKFKKLQLDYAFSGRPDKDLPGQGGRTAHSFQVSISF